ncbi:MAG: 1-acyl-sn-glycerol-3-phosphate acyltransferase [Leptospiraceae bacterium]|nr:1-acyl-sn-glycerol-3-phosphate acyltransferase [Leptospiraceae bacterium]
MNNSFIGPAIEYPFVWLLDLAFPMISKLALNIESVEITDEDKKMLRGLQNKRLLYSSNHPTTIEPPVSFFVANAMGSRFHFMASRAVFEWGYGLVGEMIKKVGAFSVLSGGLDRDSVKMARNILSSKKGKLVIYPEGMNSNENDNLLPFQAGAIQIAFWALEDAMKKEKDPDINILPAFVKYKLTWSTNRLKSHITDSIKKIETHLNVDHGERNLLRRFLFVGRIILENTEKEYSIIPDEASGFDYRIGKVRHTALNRAAENIGITLSDKMDAIEKLKELFTTLESFELGFPLPKHPGLKIPKNKIPLIKKDIEKAYTFLVIRPEYLVSRPTPERFIEWLTRFETLLFGKSDFRPRKAILSFSEPISLLENYGNYKSNKKLTVEKLNNKLRDTIEDMMIKSIPLSDPIVEPFDAGPDLKVFGINKK